MMYLMIRLLMQAVGQWIYIKFIGVDYDFWDELLFVFIIVNYQACISNAYFIK